MAQTVKIDCDKCFGYGYIFPSTLDLRNMEIIEGHYLIPTKMIIMRCHKCAENKKKSTLRISEDVFSVNHGAKEHDTGGRYQP